VDDGAAISELVTVFLEARAPSRGGEGTAGARRGLEIALLGALQQAQAAWPSVSLDRRAWTRFLGSLAPQGGASDEAWLCTTYVADLYIAFACASGDSCAVTQLEQRYAHEVNAALARAGVGGESSEEVLQKLWSRLFVGTRSSPPRIATYSGRGPLAKWLKVAAIRLAVGEYRKAHASPERATDQDVLEQLAPTTSEPEIAYVRARYRTAFEQALKQALMALTPQQRTLLRLYYIDSIGLERLGALNHVHGSTISRWLARARATLLQDATRRVRASIHLSDAEFESLLGDIRSGLHLSLAQLLPGSDR
jgi:RNA polymerase sigma-70 factor, ECF subfamily